MSAYKKYFLLLLLFSGKVFSQTKTFRLLSKYEKRWAVFHPFAALKIKKHQSEMYAVYKEVKMQRLLDTFENGGKLDAFRHCFGMAYFSKFTKVKKLRKLGIAHEKANHWQFLHGKPDEAGEMPDSLSSVMDLRNNEVGFSLRPEIKNLSASEIKLRIIELIQKGQTWIIRRNQQGAYVTCDGEVIPPEKIKGTWNIPKCLIRSDH
jgi:hypothetical protein